MPGSSRSANKGHALPPAIAAVGERTRRLVDKAAAHVAWARELREISVELRQENADFRDFLSENRVVSFRLSELRLDGRSRVKDVPEI